MSRVTLNSVSIKHTKNIRSIKLHNRSLIGTPRPNLNLLRHLNRIRRLLSNNNRHNSMRHMNKRIRQHRLTRHSRMTTVSSSSNRRHTRRHHSRNLMAARSIMRTLLTLRMNLIQTDRLLTLRILNHGTLRSTRTTGQILGLQICTQSTLTILRRRNTRTLINAQIMHPRSYHSSNGSNKRLPISNYRGHGQTRCLSTTSSNMLETIINHLTSIGRIKSRTTRRIANIIPIGMKRTRTLMLIGRILTRIALRTHTRSITPMTRRMTTSVTGNVRSSGAGHRNTRHTRSNTDPLNRRTANRITRSSKGHRIGHHRSGNNGNISNGRIPLQTMMKSRLTMRHTHDVQNQPTAKATINANV